MLRYLFTLLLRSTITSFDSMMKYLFLFVFICLASIAFSQDTRLANQYYNTGEYEKAAAIYKQLFEKSKSNSYYFNRYINCLLSLEAYDESEKAIRKQLKKRASDLHLYVTLGNLYERVQNEEAAKKEYEKAISKLNGNRSTTSAVGVNISAQYSCMMFK